MAENFILKALVISLAAHTAILCVSYFNQMNNPRQRNKQENRIEITYKPMRRKAFDLREHPIRPSQRLDLSNTQKFFGEGSFPVSMVKEHSFLPFGIIDARKPEHMRSMELSRKISIIPISSAKINNPVYDVYKRMLRDRINESAYTNYDKIELGTVYMTFLLDSNGTLKEAQIIPEKTTASEHLQAIAMKSLRLASPFPSFLKGMSLSEYTFSIEIDYQVSE